MPWGFVQPRAVNKTTRRDVKCCVSTGGFFGSGAGIRTPINRFRVCCPTFRRPRIMSFAAYQEIFDLDLISRIFHVSWLPILFHKIQNELFSMAFCLLYSDICRNSVLRDFFQRYRLNRYTATRDLYCTERKYKTYQHGILRQRRMSLRLRTPINRFRVCCPTFFA